MVPAMNTFYHTPLPEGAYIRVCTLLAGSIHDPIQCTVETVVLNPAADYEAISYTWGDVGNESYIDCNNSLLEVRPNLKSALQHLRNADRPRRLWLDRICINQNDDVEKSHQVAMMGDIFSSATGVIVWLGTPMVGDRLPVDFIKPICDRISDILRSDANELAKEIGTMNERALLEKFKIPLPGDEFWNIVNRMLNQAWFSRSWTYQEVLLGRNVQLLYGDRCMPFNVDQSSSSGPVYSFEAFLLILRLLGVYYGEAYISSFGMRLAISTVKGRAMLKYYPSDLLSNLIERRFCDTTDPRDKIYALLSVSQDSKDLGIIPDYSLSVADVFTATARKLIERHGLLILSCVENQINDGCPSWVPDWSQRQREGFGIGRGNKKKVYNATGNSKPQFGDPGNGSRLSLPGIYFDTVTLVGRYADNKSGWCIDDKVLEGGEWYAMATDVAPDQVYKPTEEPIAQAYARVCVADVLPDDSRWAKSAPGNRSLPSMLPRGQGGSSDSDDMRRKVFEQTMCRSFITTQRGYMGLGPASTVAGDHIYLLFGGQVPYVLRPADANFSYVGGCYVHGIMDGEALAEHRATLDGAADAKDLSWVNELEEGGHAFLQPEEVVLV